MLGSGNPVFIPRVLDVVKSQLCYVVGTVYMDMPLKPNVLHTIGKEVSQQSLFLLLSTLNIHATID